MAVGSCGARRRGGVISDLTLSQNRYWIGGAALALLAGAVAWHWQSRRTLSTPELLAHLPPAEAVILHVDVAALRRAGVLDLIAGSRAPEEADYAAFVAQSGFNYRQHLDTAVASFHQGQVYMVLAGRFDWRALEAYAARQGGSCDRGFCRVPASSPGRFVSFFALRPRVMALSSGPDAWGAAAMRNAVLTRPPIHAPARPVWLHIPGAALRSAGDLPSGTRLLAKALEDAEYAQISAGAAGAKLEAEIEAVCKTEEAAVLLRAQLEKITTVLKQLIQRSGGRPNPRDLSGILTQGSFRREGRRVLGRWPIERAFLESISGGP